MIWGYHHFRKPPYIQPASIPCFPPLLWQVRHEAARLAERLEKLNQARIGDTDKNSEILQERNGDVEISVFLLLNAIKDMMIYMFMINKMK